MNVIIVSDCGISQTPILVENDETAQATFEGIAYVLLEGDADEVDFNTDNQLDQVNELLSNSSMLVHWFEDVNVNKYKN